jgi:transcriptional regulator with XRE-family HTH domain
MKRRRKTLGISQAELAERAVVSPGYIGELEIARKFPAPGTLERIALALETRVYRLLMTERDFAEAAETGGREEVYRAALQLRKKLEDEMDELLPLRHAGADPAEDDSRRPSWPQGGGDLPERL